MEILLVLIVLAIGFGLFILTRFMVNVGSEEIAITEREKINLWCLGELFLNVWKEWECEIESYVIESDTHSSTRRLCDCMRLIGGIKERRSRFYESDDLPTPWTAVYNGWFETMIPDEMQFSDEERITFE